MRTVLVTGGSRGIGRGVCLSLAAEGYSLVINYAGNREAALETQSLCMESASDPSQAFHIVQADISDEQDRSRLIEEACSFTGTLDGLVNNAGVAPKERADLLDMGIDSYDRVMETNLRGPFFLTQKLAKRWQSESALPGKCIVFITSVSASMVSVNRGEYCISKSGLSQAASLFAARLAPEGTMVYEVQPGIIRTDMTAKVEGTYDELLGTGLVPQMRWGTPEDIGRTVSSLISGALPFSCGAVVTVDGGLSIPRL